jgi:transposase-like protein
MQSDSFDKFDGGIEIDESYIGGRARNMHRQVRKQKISGTGGIDKTVVVGVLQRGGRVRASVVTDNRRSTLHAHVREHVAEGAIIYTDQLKSYTGLDALGYQHKTIDHAEQYVDGRVHTNSLENFWSLLKRGLSGTYVSVQPFHLFRYLDERAFTFNERELGDLGRFERVLRAAAGKRLTYAQLTGH